jgi:hypothetical protein
MVNLWELKLGSEIFTNAESVDCFVDLIHREKTALLPNLKVLTVAHAYQNPEDTGRLFATVQETSAFSTLTGHLSNGQWPHFSSAFSSAVAQGAFPCLTKLDFDDSLIADDAMHRLCTALRGAACAKNLRSLSLQNCDLGWVYLLGILFNKNSADKNAQYFSESNSQPFSQSKPESFSQ